MKEKIVTARREHPVGFWVVIAILVGLVLVCVYKIHSINEINKAEAVKAQMEAVKQAKSETKAIQPKPQNQNEGVTLQKIVAFILLLGLLVYILHRDYLSANRVLKDTVAQPLTMTLLALLILNSIFAYATEWWREYYWNETVFFFISTISILFAVHFWMLKTGGAHFIAVLILLSTAIIGVYTYSKRIENHSWYQKVDNMYTSITTGSRTTNKTYVVGDVSSSKFNFRDVPESDKELERILDGIGKIESGNQHIDPKTGAPMRNKEGSSAIGELQIMESLHSERANALGYDIRTREGNRGYGKHLLKTLGTTPWEVDPRSFGKLVSQVGLYRPKSQFATRERIYALVALDPDKWSDPVPVINQPGIYGRYVFSWVATFAEGKGEARECQVAFNGRTDRPFPFRDYVEDELVGKKETFQYICKDKATVTLRLVPPG